MATYRTRPVINTNANRDSNALRASVLDAALELGIGNKTVANWIFNPVNEDDEEEDEEEHNPIVSPSLTSTPTATSEESYQLISLLHRPPFPGQGLSKSGDPMNGLAYSSHDGLSVDTPNRLVHFGPPSSPQHSTESRATFVSKHNKLRKARPDGYQSDGGYVSDKVDSKKDKKSKKKDKNRKAGYESDGDAIAAKKKKDRPSRDESKSSFDGEESDAGYLSEATKKKRSFFRRIKSKHQNGQVPAIVPPMPMSLSSKLYPISDKYASSRSTTPNTFNSASDSVRTSSMDTTDTSRSVTPTAIHQFKSEPTTVLTHAFGEDSHSISGSVDWSNTFSHFPRTGRSMPMPSTSSRPPSSQPTAPAVTLVPPRPLRTKPSPLQLSSVPSDYGRASQSSPVPSHVASITPDLEYTENLQHYLHEPTRPTSNMSWKPYNGLHPPPSPNSTIQSSEYIVASPIPSPASTVRPRGLGHYDLPPPSPPPSGPLPRPPPVPEFASSGMKRSKLGLSSSVGPDVPAPRVEDQTPRATEKRHRQSPYLSASEPHESPEYDRTRQNGRRDPDIYVDAVSTDEHSDATDSAEFESAQSVLHGRDSSSNEGYVPGHLYDREYDDDNAGLRDQSQVLNRQSIVDGQKSGERRNRLVKNVKAMYDKDGREKLPARTAQPQPRLPIPLKSALRNGHRM